MIIKRRDPEGWEYFSAEYYFCVPEPPKGGPDACSYRWTSTVDAAVEDYLESCLEGTAEWHAVVVACGFVEANEESEVAGEILLVADAEYNVPVHFPTWVRENRPDWLDEPDVVEHLARLDQVDVEKELQNLGYSDGWEIAL